MSKYIRRMLSVLCAIVLAIVVVAPTLSTTAHRALPWLEEDNLLEQILQRDGYLEGVWAPWFGVKGLGHSLAGNEAMMKWGNNLWYDFSTVALDDYGAAKVYQEIYNLKAMGFNMVAYAGSGYGEGVIYDDNGDVLGIQKQYLQNVRRFLTMCREIGMPLMWNICFHSSSIPDTYNMDSWWIINSMYSNPTIADHYAERFVRPLCKVLAEFPDVIAIVALTDEIENETNDSEIGNLFSGDRAMYGTTLEKVQYFLGAMNDVVKEEMPNVARTVAVNNADKSRYGDLDLDLNGHNTYNNSGNSSTPEDMVANAPSFLSEYNVSSSSSFSEAEMSRLHITFRDKMKANGLVGGFMWCWQSSDHGGAHALLSADAKSVTDFREFVYDIRYYAIDSRNEHRGTVGALDEPSLFFNQGNGVVEWIPSRQAVTMDLLGSNDGGKTWTKLLDNVPQSDYLQGSKCVFKNRRFTSDTIYKIVVRDAAGNTAESATSNHPEVAMGYVENPVSSVVSQQSKPALEPAPSAVSGAKLSLTSFAEEKNRPLLSSLNLIKNGSFEQTSNAQWNVDTFLADAVSVVEDSTAPNGGKSLFFNTSGTKTGAWYTFTVDVEPNTEYVFSAWVKGAYIADDNRFSASIGVLNPGTRTFMVHEDYKRETSLESMQIYPTAWDDAWHLRSVAFNSGSQTQISIGLYGYDSKLWVDDIALFKKSSGTTYKSDNLTGVIIDSDTDKDYCVNENSLIEDVQINGSDYWQTGSGWRNGFITVNESAVGYGNSLKYEAINPTGVYYIKWVDVQPNTQYVFSADVKVLESGAGELRLMTDIKKKPTVFYSSSFSKTSGGDWYTVKRTFNTGPFTRVGIAVCDKGGAALIDNVRLFEPQHATEGDDEFIQREPLNGWVEEDGGWAYYENDIKATDRWQADGTQKRYLTENGSAVQDAWKKIDGNWYFFDADAYMVTDKWVRDSVGWCYLGDDGVAVTNCWKKDSVGWCYLNENGSMTKSTWVNDGTGWYYLDEHGYMAANCWKKDSKGWCYLTGSGKMATNQWIKDSVGWCYVGDDGYCVTNKWVKDSKGWCYLDGSGRMVTNKWVRDSKGWCYIGEAGYCLTNKWVKDSKGWCYLDANGRMVYNTWIDGFYVNADGYWV